MANSSPPILPITENSTTTVQSTAPIVSPALKSFVNNIAESTRAAFSHSRPWSELVDRTAFSKPDSISDATLRIRKNYTYFKINYIALITLVLAFSLITNPFSLITLSGLLASWIFLYLFRPADSPVSIFGRVFSDRETLGILIVFSVAVIFLTSVGSVLISALMIGLAIVCAHGAFRVPEDLFLNEPEHASTGFLSFLGGAAASAAPSVASRV